METNLKKMSNIINILEFFFTMLLTTIQMNRKDCVMSFKKLKASLIFLY